MAKSLVDQILSKLDELYVSYENGPMARELALFFGVDEPSCRAAMLELVDASQMKIVKRGNALHLVPMSFKNPICPTCLKEFIRPPRSKKICCTRSCSIAMSWKDETTRANRLATIGPARRTPEARARTVEANNKRWAKPGARERLSEWNRNTWADPVAGIKKSVAIAKAQRTPERREFQKNSVKSRWDDEKGREKLVEGIRKSKQTPEARAKFSKLLADRWRDPEMRKKYTDGNRRRNELLKVKRAAAKLALSEGVDVNEKS